MKKLVFAVLIVLALLVGGVVFGPSLIDWNSHTDRIAQQIEKLTGRRVIIAGAIDVQVLPSPVLSVSGIKLANIAGSSEPYMASLQSLEVRISVVPLLAGRVQVESIKFIRPVVHLERLADGQVNWNFGGGVRSNDTGSVAGPDVDAKTPEATTQRGPMEPSDTASNAAPGTSSIASSIAIDNLIVEDGQIVYRDAQRNTFETFTDIDSHVAAVSLNGPIESDGAVTVRGRRIAYRLNVAEIIHGRTVPLTLGINLGDNTAFRADGSVVNLADKPRLRAKITGGGSDVSRLIAFLAGPSGPTIKPGKIFTVTGDLEADVDGGKLQGMSVKIDDTEFTIDGDLRMGEMPVADITLKSGWVDLDKWLSAPALTDGRAALTSADQASSSAADANVPADSAISRGKRNLVADKKAPNTEPFSLPSGIQASVSVRVGSMVFRGQPIQSVALNAELANGELTLSQLTAQLPGELDIGIFGILAAKSGKFRFDGEISSAAADLGPMISWLAPATKIAPGHVKNFSFKTPLIIDQDFAYLTDIVAKAGGAELTGGITFAIQRRPSFGANLKVDRLELDPWLGAAQSNKEASKETTQSSMSAAGDSSAIGTSNPSKAPTGPDNSLSILKALAGFDADVALAVGRAIYHGQAIKKIELAAKLQQGNLTVRHLRLGDFAGVRAEVSGDLSGLNGIPSAKSLKFSVNSQNLGPASKMLGLTLPLPGKDLGALSLEAIVNGGILAPTVEVQTQILGGRFAAAGVVPVLALVGKDVTLDVSAKHKDLGAFFRRLGVDYQPVGKVGGFDLRAQLSGDLKSMRVNNLEGNFGGIQVAGNLNAVLDGPRPKIGAAFALGPFNANDFRPAKRKAMHFPGGWKINRAPAAWLGPVKNQMMQAAAISPRWSKRAADYSALSVVDAAINMTSPRITLDGIRHEKVDLGAVIENGVLRIDRLNTHFFGGKLEAKAGIGLDAKMSMIGVFTDMDLSKATVLTGDAKAAGRINGHLDLAGDGRSQASLMSTLAGTLNFTGKDLNSEALSNPEAGFGLGGVVLALNQFGGSLGGPKKGGGLADVEGRFVIKNGVATPQVLSAVTNIGTATVDPKSVIDLASWTVNMSGAIKPSPSLLSAAISIATRKGINVPFSVTGDLDKPRIRVDTASLGTGGLPIPGLDRLLGKKGVGGVLEGILGAGQAPPAPSQVAPSQPVPNASGSEPPAQGPIPPSQQPESQPQPAPQKVKPADILRGLLNKL